MTFSSCANNSHRFVPVCLRDPVQNVKNIYIIEKRQSSWGGKNIFDPPHTSAAEEEEILDFNSLGR